MWKQYRRVHQSATNWHIVALHFVKSQYGAYRKILTSIGCNVETTKKESFLGIWVNPGPSIILKPDFGCCPTEIENKFPCPTSVNISARSTLFVRGSGVVIESLDLDGALIIDYRNGEDVVIKGKVVRNDGWVRVRDETSTDEIVRMRGYRIDQKDAEVMKPDDSFCAIM
jgi:UDP-sugar pyrophosphorylase